MITQLIERIPIEDKDLSYTVNNEINQDNSSHDLVLLEYSNPEMLTLYMYVLNFSALT